MREPAHAHDELRPEALALRQQLLVISDDDLRESGTVTDVDEHDTAEIANAMNPAEQGHVGANILRTELSAGMRSSEIAKLFCHKAAGLG